MSKCVEVLKGLGYKSIPNIQRSCYWLQQFESVDSEAWLFNERTATAHYREQIVILPVTADNVGHIGIAHGGFLAAILDESLCFCAYPILPHRTGMTVSLNIEYKSPTPANAWMLVRAIARGKPGSRKATVNADIYSLPSLDFEEMPWLSGMEPTVSATEIVVEPRWHDELNGVGVDS